MNRWTRGWLEEVRAQWGDEPGSPISLLCTTLLAYADEGVSAIPFDDLPVFIDLSVMLGPANESARRLARKRIGDAKNAKAFAEAEAAVQRRLDDAKVVEEQ